MKLGFYLDNAATAYLSNEMISYLKDNLDVFGNPSSAHSVGGKAKRLVEYARLKTADFIGAKSSENIYFTSSGSAGNTLGIQGYALANECAVLHPKTLHKSALKTIESLSKNYNIRTYAIEVDKYGNIDISHLKRLLQSSRGKKLVVVEYANSEIGTVQNIKEISDVVHLYDSKTFVDCTGSISTIPLNVDDLDIDIASFSAHKIGALKGVGILYKKDDIELSPVIYGSQEQGLFGGTENVLGIISLDKAIDLIDYNKSDKARQNRDFIWNYIKRMPETYLIGAPIDENRLQNNLYVCIRGVNGVELVSMMDSIFDTQISTGSACNSGSPLPSSTLVEIGIEDDDIYDCIRMSFNGSESRGDLLKFCNDISACIKMIKSDT